VIDNYDSFTYNLVQYFGELGAEIVVKRNDQVSINNVEQAGAERICISPGPGRPENAGISEKVIREFAGKMPILGVCLGHQCIAQVFGGEVVRAPRLMHGKTSLVRHKNRGIFEGLEQPLAATRYHSLIVQRENLPPDLEVTAETEEGEIMGLQHKRLPVHGVQFHPESILTVEGKKLLANFLRG
ncbi:MAG TPA: aminodeoxychorismate/anthranilate synthase component II, partial [Chthoniobacterales bacterium]